VGKTGERGAFFLDLRGAEGGEHTMRSSRTKKVKGQKVRKALREPDWLAGCQFIEKTKEDSREIKAIEMYDSRLEGLNNFQRDAIGKEKSLLTARQIRKKVLQAAWGAGKET